MFQFWFNTFFVPWHMQYQAEEEKRAAVEVWMGITLDKGNIPACTMGKTLLLKNQNVHPFGDLSTYVSLCVRVWHSGLNISISLSSPSD